ncbi:hypothetical protein C8R43DRAFT_1230852 [Mycena crocata]|nr:hypothetical protein C8R43DRAFT_1230852 [Mycena crocata]
MEAYQTQALAIRDRLRCNILPSDAEREAILRSMEAAEARRSDLQTQVPTAEVEKEMKILLQYLTDCSSLLNSPIQRLSIDLLQVIFLRPEIHDHLSTIRFSPRVEVDTPHIASVCHHWRTVALDTPTFWASIQTSIIAGPDTHTVSFRGVSQPDHVPQLPFHQIQRLAVDTVSGSMCGQLLSIFSNAHSFTVGSNLDPVRYWGEIPVPQSGPAVRTLVLLGKDTRGVSVMSLFQTMTLPNLQHLHFVDCAAFDTLISHVDRSGSRLMTLVLENARIRGPDLLELLRAIPTVEKLEMTGLIPNSLTDVVLREFTPQLALGELVLPALTHLTVAVTYLFSSSALLTMLESRMNSTNSTSALALIDFRLLDRIVLLEDLERFARLRRDAGFFSLKCWGRDKTSVRISNGH